MIENYFIENNEFIGNETVSNSSIFTVIILYSLDTKTYFAVFEGKLGIENNHIDYDAFNRSNYIIAISDNESGKIDNISCISEEQNNVLPFLPYLRLFVVNYHELEKHISNHSEFKNFRKMSGWANNFIEEIKIQEDNGFFLLNHKIVSTDNLKLYNVLKKQYLMNLKGIHFESHIN